MFTPRFAQFLASLVEPVRPRRHRDLKMISKQNTLLRFSYYMIPQKCRHAQPAVLSFDKPPSWFHQSRVARPSNF